MTDPCMVKKMLTFGVFVDGQCGSMIMASGSGSVDWVFWHDKNPPLSRNDPATATPSSWFCGCRFFDPESSRWLDDLRVPSDNFFQFAFKHGHRNSWYTHQTWWFTHQTWWFTHQTWWFFPFKMVMFHSYDSLPEANTHFTPPWLKPRNQSMIHAYPKGKSRLMWLKQCHKPSPNKTPWMGGICLPFPHWWFALFYLHFWSV